MIRLIGGPLMRYGTNRKIKTNPVLGSAAFQRADGSIFTASGAGTIAVPDDLLLVPGEVLIGITYIDGTQETKSLKVYDNAQPAPSVDGLAREVREGQASDNRRLTSLEEKTEPLETVLECSIFGVGGSSDAGSGAGVPDQPQPPQADDYMFAYYVESGETGTNLPAFILLESEGRGAMIGELSGFVPVQDTVLFFPTYSFSDDFSEISFFDGSGTLSEKLGIEHLGQTDFTVTSGSLAGKAFALSVSVGSDVTDLFKSLAGGTR